MSEIIPTYLPHQPIRCMEDQLKRVVKERAAHAREVRKLKEQVILLKKDNTELLQSCSLEKKIEYTLRDWENSEVISSIENDRKVLSVKLAKLAREELQ